MLENKEIPKQDEKLAIWSKFILNPEMLEESEMQRNKVVKKAKEELGNMTRSEYEQRLAELREKAIMDEKSHRSSWYEDGYDEGREEGRLEIVEKVIRNELTIEDMAQITGKTVEEIKYEQILIELRKKDIMDEDRLKIAKELLKLKKYKEEIIEITGLTKEELEKI